MKQILIYGVTYLKPKTSVYFFYFSSSGMFEWKEKKVFPRLEEPVSPDMEAAPANGKPLVSCVSVVWELWH